MAGRYFGRALIALFAAGAAVADQGAPVYQAISPKPSQGAACAGSRVQVEFDTGKLWCCVAHAWAACGTVSAHALLSPTHSDTNAAATPLAGDLTVRSASNQWDVLHSDSAGWLRTDGPASITGSRFNFKTTLMGAGTTIPAASRAAGAALTTEAALQPWPASSAAIGVMDATTGASGLYYSKTSKAAGKWRQYQTVYAYKFVAGSTPSSILAGPWRFALGSQIGNAQDGWYPNQAALYVWRPSTSAIVGVIADNTADANGAGIAPTLAGSCRNHTFTLSGARVDGVLPGDLLMVEWYSTYLAWGAGGAMDYLYYAGGDAPPAVDDSACGAGYGSAFVQSSQDFAQPITYATELYPSWSPISFGDIKGGLANAQLPSPLIAATYQSTAASGSNGFACSVNGCRVDLGSGANDYLYSDGTYISSYSILRTPGLRADTAYQPLTLNGNASDSGTNAAVTSGNLTTLTTPTTKIHRFCADSATTCAQEKSYVRQDGTYVGNAATASAFVAVPTGCGANQYATGIAANGNLTCASVTGSTSGWNDYVFAYPATTLNFSTTAWNTLTSLANSAAPTAGYVNYVGTVEEYSSGNNGIVALRVRIHDGNGADYYDAVGSGGHPYFINSGSVYQHLVISGRIAVTGTASKTAYLELEPISNAQVIESGGQKGSYSLLLF